MQNFNEISNFVSMGNTLVNKCYETIIECQGMLNGRTADQENEVGKSKQLLNCMFSLSLSMLEYTHHYKRLLSKKNSEEYKELPVQKVNSFSAYEVLLNTYR